MFKGSIPPTMRRILRETVDSWDVTELAVGCSGNLTIERSLMDSRVAVAGNDVNIYSCVVGQALAGQDRRLAIADEWQAEYGWLEPYLAEPLQRAATMIVASDMLDGPRIDSEGARRPFFRNKRAAYRRQWDHLHAATVLKLAQLPPLADWHTGDVGEWLDLIGDRPFASFPPFWGGGYERMFASLSAVFDWDAPTYPTLDQDRIVKLLAQMTDRPHWCLGLLERSDALATHYVGRAVTTLGGLPIHVYASSGPTRVTVKRTPAEPVGLPTLTAGDRLTGELNLRALTPPQFESLRRRFLNFDIRYTATPHLAYAVCDGERVLGAFGLQDELLNRTGGLVPRTFVGVSGRPLLFLLSDFAVSPSDYPRLSKLIVMAAVSTEVHELAERHMGHRYRGMATTAYTDRPVSMKYRGVLNLVDRAENDSASGSTHHWRLNYASPLPRWTLAEAWEQWSQRHGALR